MSYKGWVFIAVSLFATGLVFGIMTAGSLSGMFGEQTDDMKRLAELFTTLPQPSLAVAIFLKNVSAVAVSFVLSPLLWLVPILALLLNGWLLGLVSVLVLQEKSMGFLLAGLLPHGIIELTGFFIAEAVALSFGTTVILALFKKEKGGVRPAFRRSLKYLGIAFGLLLVAALIEAYITPLALKLAA